MSLNNSYLTSELIVDRQRELRAEADQERLAKIANGTRLSWWHRLMARTTDGQVTRPAQPGRVGVETSQPAPC